MSGLSRSVKNGRCCAFLRRTRGKSRRQVFPGCSSSQQMLPAIRHVGVTISQDSAPAHQASDTVELLQRETADFISPELCPPNSPDLKPVDYKFGGSCSSVCTRCRSTMSTNSSGDWLTFGAVCRKVLLTLLSANGESVCRRVFAWKEDISNTCCRLFQ